MPARQEDSTARSRRPRFQRGVARSIRPGRSGRAVGDAWLPAGPTCGPRDAARRCGCGRGVHAGRPMAPVDV